MTTHHSFPPSLAGAMEELVSKRSTSVWLHICVALCQQASEWSSAGGDGANECNRSAALNVELGATCVRGNQVLKGGTK